MFVTLTIGWTCAVANPGNTQFSVAVHLLALLADAPRQTLDSQALSDSTCTSHKSPKATR
jgi:hypothetical protein